MRPGFTTRILSHFDDQLIEASGSNFNPELYLLYSKGRYQLVTDKVIYSYEDHYDNFVEAFKHLNLNPVNNILILGYGIGSIPVILEKVFRKICHYTAVEIDPEIIRLCYKYTLSELKSSVDLIESDALTYINFETSKYDLICFDIFINDIIPQKFLNQECLKKQKFLLNNHGVFVMNTLYLTNEDKNKTNEFIENSFKPVFKNFKLVETKANMMLLGWHDDN